MGKSPGKWIKAVLFGKKSSKSQLSKDVTGDKRSSTRASVENLAANAPIQNFDRGSEDTKLEKGTNTGITCDNAALSSVTPDIESQVIEEPISGFSADDAELKSIEQAATKAQAAFRGYLARRAFRALKGIIRLQALIRGHLVRRQAVATLRCMQAVVRVQALARGRRVRLSDCARRNFNSGELKDAKQVDVSAVNMSVWPVKLTSSAFVCKLLAAVPMAMPLSLQYDECEPNSVWQWLERWSLSHFWEPLPKPKKIVDAKSQKKQAGLQTVEIEPVRSRRSVRKVFSAAIGDANTVSSSEPEKPRRNIRTVTTHQIEPVQDQPQNELERVKWNLRKVTGAMATPLERSETEYAKAEQIPIPAQTQAKTSFAASNVGEAVVVNSSEETSESNSKIDKLAMTEAPTPVAVEEPNDVLHDHPTVEQQQLEVENVGKSENSLIVNEELSSKEDQTSKERTRRRSLPSKQENSENISQNTPSVPSYMAATKSAKAKLKAQGSPIVSEEGAENGVVRRHSLPSSTNGKFSSLSPRVQRPVQANGKSGNKNSRSLSASKDEKVLQPGWKR